jgi:pSer/pThr/pTyr-binding forkhead associated (FHA) protein
MDSKTRKGLKRSTVTDDDVITQIIHPSDNTQSESGREESGKLVVIQGKTPGRQISLERPETTIGRLPDNHLVLDSTTVSRHHARVLKDSNRYEIEDLNSRNGIAMNGEQLKSNEQRALIHGDTLRFGDHQLVFLNPSGFSDHKGISTITFDRDKVTAEVDAVLKRLPLMKRSPARKADPGR